MPTPTERPRPTPREEEQPPPRVRVTRGSSQNNTNRHHPPRGSQNVRPFDQDTLEREANNNDVEEVEVDVIDDNSGSDDDDDGAQRFLPLSENQHQSHTEELNVHGNNGHIDIDTDNVNDDDADEDIGEENNDDDDDDDEEVEEEEEEESNDEEMEESNVLREPRPTHTHNAGDDDDDDDNAGDDDHHHVSDNNAEDNDGRQQAEDRNSCLNYLAMNLVRMSNHYANRSSQNNLNVGRMWSRRKMLDAGRIWSPFSEHDVNREIIFDRKWERWCRQTNWKEKAFFALCRGIYLAHNNITNEYKAGFIFDETLHDRLVNIYQGTCAQVEVMFISTNDALPKTHLATLEAYLKFALFLQLRNEDGRWVSCYSSVGEVFGGVIKETCKEIMNDVYKFATYRLGDEVPMMAVRGHGPLKFTEFKKHPLFIDFLYKVDPTARNRHIYCTCQFTNGNNFMMDEWEFQELWRDFARRLTTRCDCMTEKIRERTKLDTRIVDIDAVVAVNDRNAEELERRYDVDSFVEKLKRKNGVGQFNWPGLGYQVGVCFSALPSNCSFLNGPIDANGDVEEEEVGDEEEPYDIECRIELAMRQLGGRFTREQVMAALQGNDYNIVNAMFALDRGGVEEEE